MPRGLRKDAKVQLISKAPLFAGLSKRELAQLATISDELDLPADKVLIREGERGHEFFVLLDGQAEVRRRRRKLATLTAGEFFGEIALVSAVPRVATVTTTSPVRVLVIRDVEFRRLLQQVPEIGLKVLSAVAARLPADDL